MSEWNEYKLGEVIDVRDGTHDSPKEALDGKYLITSRHIKDGKIDFEKAYKISWEDFINVNKRSKVDKWDILFTMIGTIGEMAVVDFEPDFAIKNVGLFKTGNKDLAKWIYYYLKSDVAQGEIHANRKGTTQEYITLGDLRNFPIAIPPLPEQKSIAAILSSLDDKIDLLHRQNKTLEALAETLFRQWFVEEAEEGWEIGTIEDEFSFTMGQSPSGSSFNEEGKGMVFFQGRTDFGFRFPDPRVYTDEPNRLARKFDTLVSVRAPVGDMNMAVEECCLGRGVAAFRYKDNPSYHTYTYYKLRSLMAQIKQFEDSGTVFGSIGKDDFNKLKNILPSSKLVEKFQAQAAPLDEKIYKNTLQIKTLTRLRDTLLPKLMSGEVRVKEVERFEKENL